MQLTGVDVRQLHAVVFRKSAFCQTVSSANRQKICRLVQHSTIDDFWIDSPRMRLAEEVRVQPVKNPGVGVVSGHDALNLIPSERFLQVGIDLVGLAMTVQLGRWRGDVTRQARMHELRVAWAFEV